MENNKIEIYQTPDSKASIEVKLEHDTVWLNQMQMVELFQQSKQIISLHIKNIFKENELIEFSVVKESLTTATDGKKYQTRYYNLDVIISVGYRIKSQRGTQFRIWANHILKDFLVKGYAVNEKRLHEQSRQLDELKQTVKLLGNLSIIPNPVSVLYPGFNGLKYNRLIERIQGDPGLKMKVVDIYATFKNSDTRVYQRSDTHWNIDGAHIWLNTLNSVMASQLQQQ